MMGEDVDVYKNGRVVGGALIFPGGTGDELGAVAPSVVAEGGERLLEAGGDGLVAAGVAEEDAAAHMGMIPPGLANTPAAVKITPHAATA
jgi:diacylglycerol kinase family enzyme